MLSPLYQILVSCARQTIRLLIGKLNLGHAAKVYFVGPHSMHKGQLPRKVAARQVNDHYTALRHGLDTFADSLAATIVT